LLKAIEAAALGERLLINALYRPCRNVSQAKPTTKLLQISV
jgi:hypothetical protein